MLRASLWWLWRKTSTTTLIAAALIWLFVLSVVIDTAGFKEFNKKNFRMLWDTIKEA